MCIVVTNRKIKALAGGMTTEERTEAVEQSRGLTVLRKDVSINKASMYMSGNLNLMNTANKIVFQLSKAAVRFKQNLATKTVQFDDYSEDGDSLNRSLNLSLHLSSFESPSDRSDSSCSIPPVDKPSLFHSLSDLPSIVILSVAKYSDAKLVRNLAQTCSTVRRIILSSAKHLAKQVVTRYELIIRYNYLTSSIVVRALKRNRSVNDEVFTGATIEEVIPKLVSCMARITFGHGVNVYEWRKILLSLHASGQLTPLALLFTGGEMSKGNQTCCGADLRSFTETEFINFVGHFYPHVQEVQLLTTRLFKTVSCPARLLSFVPMLSYFGISYERPAVKFFFDDVKQVVSYWRHDPLSRNSTVYMRAPAGGCMMKWINIGGTVEGCTTGVHRVTIAHMFQSGTFLTFYLH